ncbi:hypothetical protein EV189_2899 [Motilibacter rhizosphaerae]|uniref:DNA-binding beta-propeller fold protein YncE n=1 Tax=Motilibacter rhizosphaerae TaxID=598652 RepID=A0A4Q7NQT3_9ACTN|nr:DUF4369 domain-containing protein [Motilibacter rhizosphaerae]RZS87468.1 hypothetical protein EV189_2899 [Motilibacter rhizosphaerae]
MRRSPKRRPDSRALLAPLLLAGAVAAAPPASAGGPAGAYAVVADGGTVWAVPLQGAPRRLLDNAGAGAEVALSADGALLAVFGPAGVLVADTRTGEAREVLAHRAYPGAFSPDDRTLYVGELDASQRDGDVRALDLATGTSTVVADPPLPVRHVALASDGRTLGYTTAAVTTGAWANGEAHVVDLATGADSRVGLPGDFYVGIALAPAGPLLTRLEPADTGRTRVSVVDAAGRSLVRGDALLLSPVSTPAGTYAVRVVPPRSGDPDPSAELDLVAPGGARARTVVAHLPGSGSSLGVATGPPPHALRLRSRVVAASLELAGDPVAGAPLDVAVDARTDGPGSASATLDVRPVGSSRWRAYATVPVRDGAADVPLVLERSADVRLRAGARVVSAVTRVPVAWAVSATGRREGGTLVLAGRVRGASGGRVLVLRLVDGRWQPLRSAAVTGGRFSLRLRLPAAALVVVVRPADAAHAAGASSPLSGTGASAGGGAAGD